MLNLVQDLRIGTKLAIASALGILSVAAMIASQIVGNGNVRQSNQAALMQQELARDAVEIKFWVRSMQVSARDSRLASNTSELQPARDGLVESARSLTNVADGMLKRIDTADNRARIEKIK